MWIVQTDRKSIPAYRICWMDGKYLVLTDAALLRDCSTPYTILTQSAERLSFEFAEGIDRGLVRRYVIARDPETSDPVVVALLPSPTEPRYTLFDALRELRHAFHHQTPLIEQLFHIPVVFIPPARFQTVQVTWIVPVEAVLEKKGDYDVI